HKKNVKILKPAFTENDTSNLTEEQRVIALQNYADFVNTIEEFLGAPYREMGVEFNTGTLNEWFVDRQDGSVDRIIFSGENADQSIAIWNEYKDGKVTDSYISFGNGGVGFININAIPGKPFVSGTNKIP